MSQGGVNESQSTHPPAGPLADLQGAGRGPGFRGAGRKLSSQPERPSPPAGPDTIRTEARRYDLETPGPTEAAGGSFQVVSTPAEAERA